MTANTAPRWNPVSHGPTYTPLKTLFARRGLLWGTSSGTSVMGDRMAIRDNSMRVDQGQALMVTTQNTEGVWNFTNAKVNSNFAIANNLPLHQGGHLIWYAAVPGWLASYTTASGLRGIYHRHIERTLQGLPEYQSWNVTNEQIVVGDGNPGGWRTSQQYTVLGADWPGQFYKHARLFTDKELIWNDDQAIETSTSAAFDANLLAIKTALNSGAPINTFGTQLHMALNGTANASGAQMVDRLNQIAALGLDIRITEFDISDTTGQWTTLSTRRAQQIAHVESRLGPIIKQVSRLRSINMWCQNDEDSWLNTFNGPRTDNQPREFTPYGRDGYMKKEWWDMFDRITAP